MIKQEKQIEEMAKCCTYYHNGECCADMTHISDCDLMCQLFGAFANLVMAGYRKERQGEWEKVSEKYPRYACTSCNHLYNNKGYQYCPHCGAKMKGE